jgi:hypothetical protein
MVKRYVEMTPSERIKDRIAKNRAIEERLKQGTAKPKKPLRRAKVFFSENEPLGFSQPDVFPAIASVMEALCGAGNNFVTHRQIVLAICSDASLTHRLREIVSNDPAGRSTEWWADNMMKWFSQTFTIGRNPYSDMFERDDSTPYRYRLRK